MITRRHTGIEAAARRAIRYVVSHARRESVRVLMYHGISAERLPVYDWCQVQANEFAEQVRILSESYRVLPLSEIVARLEQGRPLPPRPAALTFDDGFRNVYTTAMPILEQHGVPATIFLVTGLLDSGLPPWPSLVSQAISTTAVSSITVDSRTYRLETTEQREVAIEAALRWLKRMSAHEKNLQLPQILASLAWEAETDTPDSPVATLRWSEVEEMSRSPLFEFGGHTHNHEILARCSPRQHWAEISQCAQVLRDRLDRVNIFAYPNGTPADFTALTKTAVRESGFLGAVTTIRGINNRGCDLFELKRVAVGRGAPLWQFEEQLAGL